MLNEEQKIFTKDDNGKIKELGTVDDTQLQRIVNDKNIEIIKNLLKEFWTEAKLGKQKPDIINKHGQLILKNLKGGPELYFRQLNKNKFIFKETGFITWSSFLQRCSLDKYLDEAYINEAMKITTPRPAIGKGEFLLVSCFKNIRFASGSGDLTNEDNELCELKGVSSILSGDGEYKTMNDSLVFSIYSALGCKPLSSALTSDVFRDIDEYISSNAGNNLEKFMLALQNLEKPSNNLAAQMVKAYKDNEYRGIEYIITAAHLMIYLKRQKANFIIFLNEKGFRCFNAPKNMSEAIKIAKHLEIYGWKKGSCGVSVTLKG